MTGLAGDAASIMAAQGVALVAGLATSAIAARCLGPHGRGIVAVAGLWVSFFALATPLSCSYGLIYQLRNSGVSFREAISGALGLALVAGLLAIAGALVLARPCAHSILKDTPFAYIAIAAAVLPAAIASSQVSLVMVGGGLVRQASLIGAATSIVGLAMTALCLVVLRLGVWGAMVASALTTLLQLAMYVFCLRRHINWRALLPRELCLSSLRFGARLHVGMLAQWANYSLDRFLVNLYLGASSVGIYVVSAMLAERLWMLPASVGASLYSRTGGPGDTGELTARACRSTVGLMSVACVAAGVAAPVVVPLLFGAEFRGSVLVLVALLPGVLVLSAGKVVAPYITNHNRPAVGTWITLISLAETIALNLLLLPRIGIFGSALASTAAYCTNGVLFCVVFVRMSGIRPGLLLRPRGSELRSLLNWRGVIARGWRARHLSGERDVAAG